MDPVEAQFEFPNSGCSSRLGWVSLHKEREGPERDGRPGTDMGARAALGGG